MELFFRLFSIPVPMDVVVASILLMGAVIGTLSWKNRFNRKSLCWVLLVWYIAMILCATVICRTPGTEYRYELRPLWSIGAIRSGLVEVYYEKLYNVLFFIPVGVILACFSWKKMNWWKAFAFGVALSCVTEFLQLITKTGECEIDDVITNSLGCLIGYLVIRGIMKLLKK